MKKERPGGKERGEGKSHGTKKLGEQKVRRQSKWPNGRKRT